LPSRPHAIKGGAASIGAAAMAELAREIEALGRSGDLARVEGLGAELDEAFERTRSVLGREAPPSAG